MHAGMNIIISTPGRLLQHMDETPGFDCSQLQVLALDEADRILDMVSLCSFFAGFALFLVVCSRQ